VSRLGKIGLLDRTIVAGNEEFIVPFCGDRAHHGDCPESVNTNRCWKHGQTAPFSSNVGQLPFQERYSVDATSLQLKIVEAVKAIA
jgi:hypothetical protein